MKISDLTSRHAEMSELSNSEDDNEFLCSSCNSVKAKSKSASIFRNPLRT